MLSFDRTYLENIENENMFVYNAEISRDNSSSQAGLREVGLFFQTSGGSNREPAGARLYVFRRPEGRGRVQRGWEGYVL